MNKKFTIFLKYKTYTLSKNNNYKYDKIKRFYYPLLYNILYNEWIFSQKENECPRTI